MTIELLCWYIKQRHAKISDKP